MFYHLVGRRQAAVVAMSWIRFETPLRSRDHLLRFNHVTKLNHSSPQADLSSRTQTS